MAGAICILAVWFFAAHGWLYYYGDAEAHLNIARRLFDTPAFGWEQLGSPWLPLPHVLIAPFAASDSLWRNGLAGSIPTAACFVTAALFLFAAVRESLGSSAAAWTAMLVLLHGPRYRHFVRLTRPHAGTLRTLLALGLPSGGSVAVEGGLFAATGILASRLGPQVLAAHLIALSVITVVFMIPLSISQAANVRVATACGGGRRDIARRAGLCAIALAACFMACVALTLRIAPHAIIRLYLGPTTPATAATEALAVTLLGVAGVFQIFDGTQVAASGALRGLQDVRVPMVLAAFGYWGVGFTAGWLLAFPAHLGAVGLWWGLCAGLAAVALCLSLRFAHRSRVTRREPARDTARAGV